MHDKDKVNTAVLRAQVELQQALQALEKMPACSQEDLAFAAHSLNNYLTVTAATLDLLLWSLTKHPDPQVQTWLEGLGHIVELMRHSVSQLTASAANDSPHLAFRSWDLATLVRRACLYYQRLADRKQIVILPPPDLVLPPVYTDPVAVAVVLDNLLSNAVKFTRPATTIRVSLCQENDRLLCAIGDEGPGLSREEQARLFQKGVRLSPQPTGGESSNGYGLAVAKEMIDKLGGSLWCESVQGEGASFVFSLPLAENAST
jgi:two-component system, sensor histidine kinase and response regulator